MCECWGEGGEENETYTQHTHKYTHTHYINSPRSQLGIMKFVSAVTQKLLLWQWHLGISANIRDIQTTWQWQVSIWDFHKLMWQLLKFSQRAGPKCWGQHQMPVTANDQSSQCWESRGRAPDTMISNFFFLISRQNLPILCTSCTMHEKAKQFCLTRYSDHSTLT